MPELQHFLPSVTGLKNAFRPDKPALESCLRQALERGEFALIYQPQISLLTNEIEGFEALLRCDNPALAKCAPEQFLPVLEESGLILPVGRMGAAPGLPRDRSFTADIESDTDSAAIASAIIMLAHRLGMTVIAEGVETKGQLHFLQQNGCDLAQGYHFAKPAGFDELHSMISAMQDDDEDFHLHQRFF